MANLSARLSLQESRLSLIQQAAEIAFDELPTPLTRQLITTRFEVLDSNWSKFQSEHEYICQTDLGAIQNEPYMRTKTYERCQEFYVHARAALLVQQEESEGSNRSSRSIRNVTPVTMMQNHRSSLPRISLPRFSGDYQSWRSFQDLFTSMIIDNPDLTNVERMHYLKSCLAGEAFRLISNVPVSSDSFKAAWDTLLARYENKRFLISAQLDKLTSLKPLKPKSASDLRAFLTTVTECLSALRALDCQTHYWDSLLLHLLVRLLDTGTREAWEVRVGSSTRYPTFTQFEEFLTCRTRAMENLALHSVSSASEKDRPTRQIRPPQHWESSVRSNYRAKAHVAAPAESGYPSSCPLCRSNHHIAVCSRYHSLSPQQRKEEIAKRRLCYNCLGNHYTTRCSSLKRCRKCGHKHHTTLHWEAVARPPSSNSTAVKGGQAPVVATPADHHTGQAGIKTDGGLERVRFLIDQGSELSFITENLVSRLRLRRRSASIPLLGIGGTFSGRTRGVVNFQLQSLHDPIECYAVQAYILPRLTRQLPSFTAAKESWLHLEGLQLADPDYGRPGPIQLLIGSDFYGQIIRPDIVRGEPGSPVAQLTIFGWILSGPVAATGERTSATGYHCSADHELHELLSRFWTQEEVQHSGEVSLSPEDALCEAHFKSTHTRDSTGRYVVRLPLKAPVSSLGDSETAARRCLSRLRNRFAADPIYQQRYSEFISEYESLGHLVTVPNKEIGSTPAYYLPHHGVVREHSQTTKLRVVFNGSSRTSTGISLNDILHAGPKLQTEISDVLLWIRLHRFIFTTDITKMYRQIKIHPDDWDLQRIFWYNAEQQHIAYRLTTVTYGLNCAPYLAVRTIQELVEDEGRSFPLAIPALTKGRYVDDIFGGAESIKEAQMMIEQLIRITTAGGFPLQKWNSNCLDVLGRISNTRSTASSVELEPSRIKILGLCWQPTIDCFKFTSWPSPTGSITKRAILSEVAQLYDPLGMLSPVLVRAKMFIQELWIAKVGWDEALPLTLQERWNTFRQQLPHLSELTIPRWLNTSSTDRVIELHGFSDASRLAMAAVVYIKVINNTGKTSVTFVQAKTKVASLKQLTIPRLELSAALLLARLVSHTQKALDLSNAPVFLWTDSTVTLTWLSTHPSRWKDFVRNRVTSIHEAMPHASWRFVPGRENPADCASRGLRVEQLIQHPLWLSGPIWLMQSSAQWPASNPHPTPDTDLEERPGEVFSISITRSTYWTLLDRYSSLTRLLRITSVCRRATDRFRKRLSSSVTDPISPLEIQNSCLYWVKAVQLAWFSHEFKVIQGGGSLSKANALTRLTPFVDKFGLLRVGGRLQHSRLDPEAKHPLLLPRHSPFTKLIIADAHHKTLHGGTQVTMAYIRRTYWIVRGRAPVRSFILQCVRCARYRGLRAQQLMGQLPAPRVTPSRPYLNTGVGYAGPVSIKTWRGRAARIYKGYLAIFVCFSTSAVHLELVTDYTSEAFIAAYKRFVGRRGICAALHSDCGTNFVGADVELRKLFDSASKEAGHLASLLANEGTTWHFNPPSAPHFGGKWEAAVKSTKFHLLRTIGDSILTYEELTTILVQIEAILNSRPLCPLSDDAEDISALTPGHFLIGEALVVIPEPTLLQEPISRLSKWQLLRQKVEHFWARWSAECLQRFQAISKWHHPSNQIKVGSLVLITDERYPPAKWPLARVLELHPGADGLTRVVTVRTSTTIFKRPISKLCILPTDPTELNSATNSLI